MKEREFARLLEAFGAEPDRWPAAQRPAALALLRTSPVAQGLAAEAAALDRLLDAAPDPAQPPLSVAAVVERVCATPQLGPQRQAAGRSWEIRIAWPNLVGLAMAGVVGFVVGWSGLDSSLGPILGADAAQLLYGSVNVGDPAW